MLRRAFVLILLIPTLSWSGVPGKSAMTATDLRCEYGRSPLGIDATHPRFGWILQSRTDEHGQRQSAYRILVASSVALLAQNSGDLWDSREKLTSDQNNIPYLGSRLKSGQVCFWKVKVWDGQRRASPWSVPAHWEMGLLRASDWKALWLNDGKSNPTSDQDFYKEDPAPLFRKEFRVGKAIKRARLYITGLGFYEASLNGERVGDHMLDPGWTKFDTRVLYSTYDVTQLLTKGANCLGITLGNGWYNSLPMRMWGNLNLREHLATGRPRFISQLRIQYWDGSAETVISNTTWRVGNGPILRNNIYLGEVYDARKAQSGWNKAGFGDTKWRSPGIATSKIGSLVAQAQPPIRITSSWNPVTVTQPSPGVFIYDMGVNFAGLVRLRLSPPRGTRMVVRYGELLHADGTLNPMTSVAGQIKTPGIGGPGAPDIAWQSDTFIAKGGEETYTPRFTFHGFRYAEITGLPKSLPLSGVTALRLNADVDTVGSFACSNPMLNQIHAMCRRTFLSNIFSVQSDCPHRERMGYGGDISATSEAFLDNFDMSTFYAKSIQDWADSARPDGMFTDTAPSTGIQYCGVCWAMAHPTLITHLYRYFGNRQILEEQYGAAKRWLLLVEKQNPGGLIQEGLSDHESLVSAPAPEMVSPMYYRSAQMLADMAHRLLRTKDEEYFVQLGQRIRRAYVAKFFDATTGKVGPGTQASQAFNLYTEIIPAQSRARALQYLREDIRRHGGHLTTGILGTKFLLEVLSREGHADEAYNIVTQPDFPGWGWMLKNGATTLWEHWELSDNTFSHNHPMFGSVSQWMMEWLGGIQAGERATGFDRIQIHPQVVEGLNWVNSNYRSIRGQIVSNWSRRGRQLTFEIETPLNTQAHVTLPGVRILENGRPLSGVQGVTSVSKAGKSVNFNLASGHYLFRVSL